MGVATHIRRRTTGTGARYQVRFRRGGRGFRLEHAGTFPSRKAAEIRRDLVAGWLAAGKDPRAELRALAVKAPERTVGECAKAYRASRIDLSDQSLVNMRSHIRRIEPMLGGRLPSEITPADVQEWIVTLTADLKPGSVKRYVNTLQLILDFAGGPNPARDKNVRLPTLVRTEPAPPTARQFLAMLDRIPHRWRLPLVVLEQTGMAVGEAHELAWGDVDVAGDQFRLRRATVKAAIRARARWVQVPDWLMDLIDESCPLDDRTADRPVFPGFTPDVAKNVMARGCVAAKVPHSSPHKLRHRRLSLWHGQGIPARELANRAGHSKPSMSLDIYSHVMPLDEATPHELEAALRVIAQKAELR